MASVRGRHPELIGVILKERIGALGWESRMCEEEVLTGWDAAVGPQIAAHARPSHITNHQLTIVTESPVWTQQLSLLKPDLLRRIARRFGPAVVTDLFFVTGKIEPTLETPTPAAARSLKLTMLPAAFESELAAIADLEVRESFRRVMLAALATDGVDEPDMAPS